MTPKALSREIKFRAWDGERMKNVASIGWIDGELDYISTPKTSAPANDFVLMQFTGLHDKNGKEICEGDVVELQHWEPKRYEVVFNRGGFCLKFGEDSHFYPDIKYAEDSEVIGNIYEHPYLLTKENK